MKKVVTGKVKRIKKEEISKAEAIMEMRQVIKKIALGQDLWERKRELKSILNRYND